jgi:acetylornithine deacetylase/succinyl-diaminopimelate desuccinylase-like protein
MRRVRTWLLPLCLQLAVAPLLFGQSGEETNRLAREIFKQLIEINTTDSVGNVTTAAEAMATRLREAGFAAQDVTVAGPNERKKNMVAKFRGAGKRKPILFIGHLDVVEAHREDWTSDPFKFIEKDGYFYGRGTEDMKEGDAMLVTNFIRLKKEGFLPDRDLILALTADEEGGNSNGIDWLLREHRDWINAEYCINLDGGEFEKDKGKLLSAAIQASEKVYVDFQFESLNPGGHSSVPSMDNAIYHLSAALSRLQSFSFPVEINEITRNYFARTAALTRGQFSARRSPSNRSTRALYNAYLRTPISTHSCTPLASPQCSPEGMRSMRCRRPRAPT